MNMFKNWVPGEVYWFVIVPLCAIILVLVFGPKLCTMSENDRKERLFKECVERHPVADCQFILREPTP